MSYKLYNMKELMFLKELILISQKIQKNVSFFIIGILKTLVLNMSNMSVTEVMIYQ